MNLLLTSGATREPIDAVRFLSNVSTGGTGAALAAALAERGHTITLLHGEAAVRPPPSPAIACEPFGSTADLADRLRARLATGAYDAVIHCAAVSDYTPAETAAGKLSSDRAGLTLHLVPTPKLLPLLKTFAPAGRAPTVVGFKLTAGADRADRDHAVATLFARGNVDHVIHNDLADRAAHGDARPFRAYSRLPSASVPDLPTSDLQTCDSNLPGLPALIAWLEATLAAPAKNR